MFGPWFARIGNLAKLDLEQNIIYPGRGNAVHLAIDQENVKNRQSLEFPLPAESVELMERYLREFRPLLAPAGSTALFPGGKGLPKTTRTLRQQITDTVHYYTGLRVNPHLFRHAMGKLFLDANPGQYEVLRRVYGHKSIYTTSRYYTGQETAAAVRLFDHTILRLRKERV
jgi:site-specific recombinase XerD